jgi:hypothetical protein
MLPYTVPSAVGVAADTARGEPATVGAFAKLTTWAELIVIAVVGVAPVWSTSVPVVSAVTLYAVVVVVLALIVDI